MKKFFYIITIFCFVSACGSDALTLKKKSSTDEFLVEKKSPLVLPPNYGELPLPSGAQIETKVETNNEFESLITSNKKNTPNEKEHSNPTSIKKSILEKIK